MFYVKKSALSTYTTIEDLMINPWWKIHSTGNLFLLVKGEYEETKKNFNYLSNVWDDIKEQHVEKFGIEWDFIRYIEARDDLKILELEYAITQNRMDWTLWQMEKRTFDIKYKPKKVNEFKIKAMIEKSLGVRIDPNTTSVVEYYSYIELLNEMSKQQKAN